MAKIEMCRHYTVKHIFRMMLPWCSYLDTNANIKCHAENSHCPYYEPSIVKDKPNVVGNAEK